MGFLGGKGAAREKPIDFPRNRLFGRAECRWPSLVSKEIERTNRGVMGDDEQREADALRTRELVAEAHRLRQVIAAAEADLARTHADAFALAEEQTGRLRDASTREREMPLRSMAAELAVDARMSDRTMQTHLFDAHRTVTQFPVTWEAWHDGRVSRAHVRVIVEAGAELDDEHARVVFEQDVLGYAETTSPSRVRSYAEQVAEKLNPRSMQERHDKAVLDRRVWVEDLRDGMSMLGAIGPSVEIHGVYDRLTRQGKAVKAADRAARREVAEGDGGPVAAEGDGERLTSEHNAGPDGVDEGVNGEVWFDVRTLDQIRTDLLLDMMLTSTPSVDGTDGVVEGGLGAIRAHVQVTVPATTLAGTTTGGAELDGRCAVDPETARILAGNAPGFDRVLLDPIGGAVLAVDRRHATAAQKRYLMARDVRCRFPGCRRPARDCEWDHREDYALGGKTDVENLGAFLQETPHGETCSRMERRSAPGWEAALHRALRA